MHIAHLHILFLSKTRSWFTKAEQLRQRQEQLIANRGHMTKSSPHQSTEQQLQTATEDGDSDSEELDLDSLLNWRAKIS